MSCCGVSPFLCLKLAATDAGTAGSMAHASKSEHAHLDLNWLTCSLWVLHAGANARVSASHHPFWLVSGAWVSPWGPRPSELASCHSSPKAALRLKQTRLRAGPTTSCAAVHGSRAWLCGPSASSPASSSKMDRQFSGLPLQLCFKEEKGQNAASSEHGCIRGA